QRAAAAEVPPDNGLAREDDRGTVPATRRAVPGQRQRRHGERPAPGSGGAVARPGWEHSTVDGPQVPLRGRFRPTVPGGRRGGRHGAQAGGGGAAGERGKTSSLPEDGGGRASRGRGGPRLQQSAHHYHRPRRIDAPRNAGGRSGRGSHWGNP